MTLPYKELHHKSQIEEQKTGCPRATPNEDVIAAKRLFFPNTAEKSHDRRQPCHGIFALSWKEISPFAVLRSFESDIFVHNAARGRRNTGCISRTMVDVVDEKFDSKPVTSLFGAAQAACF